MRHIPTAGAVAVLSIATAAAFSAQSEPAATRDAHVAAARAAAGSDHVAVFDRLCGATPAPPQTGRSGPAPAPQPPGPPDRSQWHAEPVKVFDNLYFVGQTEYSAWAVTTSAGIILIDTII